MLNNRKVDDYLNRLGTRLASVEESQATLREYSGRVNASAITGITKVANGTGATWKAERHADR
jgi:hypothetical protein